MEGPRVSGPWLDFWGGNAICVNRPLIYRSENLFFLPCGTMFHTDLYAGDVAAPGWPAQEAHGAPTWRRATQARVHVAACGGATRAEGKDDG